MPNTGRSPVIRTMIGDPQKDEDKKDRDAAARQEKEGHDKQQDADRAKQNDEKKAGVDPNAPADPRR